MPSMPRLRTPDFSTTSSPSGANIRGVAAMMVPVKMAMNRSIRLSPAQSEGRSSCRLQRMRVSGGPYQANAIKNEEVGCEQEEQKDALEDARQRRGQAQRHLHT